MYRWLWFAAFPVFILLLLAATLPAPKLPEFTRLMREARDLYEKVTTDDEMESPLTLEMLARAHVYAGDLDAGLKLARSLQDEYWRKIALTLCYNAAAEAGKFPAELPEDFEPFTRYIVLNDYSRIHADRGDTAAALAALRRVPVVQETAWYLPDAYRYVAQAQLRTREPEGARATLNEAFSLVKKFPRRSERSEQLTGLIETLIEADDRATARECLTLAVEETTRFYNDEAEPSSFGAIAWARIGKAHLALGRPELADDALRRAEKIARSIRRDEQFRNLEIGDRVRTFTEIARIQLQMQRPMAATSAVQEALAFAAQAEDESSRAYQVSGVAKIQLESGEVNRAVQIVETTPLPPYWKARLHLHIAAAARNAGDNDVAKKHQQAAVQITDALEKSDKNKLHLLIDVAESQAQFGDLDSARKSFQQARELADAVEDEEDRIGYYQSLARGQVRAGLLPEAYATTQAMGDSQWKLFPLSELVLAVAKRKAL